MKIGTKRSDIHAMQVVALRVHLVIVANCFGWICWEIVEIGFLQFYSFEKKKEVAATSRCLKL